MPLAAEIDYSNDFPQMKVVNLIVCVCLSVCMGVVCLCMCLCLCRCRCLCVWVLCDCVYGCCVTVSN